MWLCDAAPQKGVLCRIYMCLTSSLYYWSLLAQVLYHIRLLLTFNKQNPSLLEDLFKKKKKKQLIKQQRTWLTLINIKVAKWDTCNFCKVPPFDVLHHTYTFHFANCQHNKQKFCKSFRKFCQYIFVLKKHFPHQAKISTNKQIFCRIKLK